MTTSVSIIEIPDAPAQCLDWRWGTILYKDETGKIVGCGRFDRLGDNTVELEVTFGSSVSALFSEPLHSAGG